METNKDDSDCLVSYDENAGTPLLPSTHSTQSQQTVFKGFDACTDVDSDQMQFGNDSQDVEILYRDASIEIMGTTHDQKKNYTPFVFVTDCSIHFRASKYERIDNNKP